MIRMSVITPQLTPSGTNSMLNFFTGALDVAYMGSSPFMLAHLYNLPVRIISIANAHNGSLAILKGAEKPENEKNRKYKLGTTLGSDGQVLAFHFSKSLKENNKPIIVNLSPEECIEALSVGLIDYAALWEPFVSIAKKANNNVVFTDKDLNFKMYSFIVATDKAIINKTSSLTSFLQLHSASIDQISNQLPRFLPRLRLIFGSDIDVNRYHIMLRDEYYWPGGNYLEDKKSINSDLEDSLKSVYKTHFDLGNGEISDFSVQRFFPSGRPVKDLPDLNLGYSNSIMCATFHVADLSKSFSEFGLKVDSSNRRIEERIALLQEKWQNDIKLCYELLQRDPELVVQKIGRMNEQLFREIEESLIGETSKSIAAVIQSLRDKKLIPRDILSWADSIRSIRNVATHDNEKILPDESQNAFNIFLNILEWYEQASQNLFKHTRCPQCYNELNKDWNLCPRCGKSVQTNCSSCKKELKPEWKVCPYCGVKQN